MSKNFDPVINFTAWELVRNVGSQSRGEHIITTFVSKITQLDSYRLFDDDEGMRAYTVSIDCLPKYFITSETYDLIKERMYKGTPIKIEEVVCVERV